MTGIDPRDLPRPTPALTGAYAGALLLLALGLVGFWLAARAWI